MLQLAMVQNWMPCLPKSMVKTAAGSMKFSAATPSFPCSSYLLRCAGSLSTCMSQAMSIVLFVWSWPLQHSSQSKMPLACPNRSERPP